MDLPNKRAIITGAGAGFGLALAKRLLQSGVRVAALDVDEQSLDRLHQEHPDILPVTCNVADVDQVEQAVERVFDNFGGLEILVNNAGIMRSAPLINPLHRTDRRHSLDLWQQVMAVNLNGVFYLTRAVADAMLARRNKGVIVNVSSIAARGNAGQTAYSASKAGVEAMTKVWAKELGRVGIRCVAVAPGFIDTAGTAEAIEERFLEKWIEATPLRRTGAIDEIVDAFLFALQNDFLNGEVISINGGLVL
jgi:3-oxoacyl-[acyl-carrier protein] reductase